MHTFLTEDGNALSTELTVNNFKEKYQFQSENFKLFPIHCASKLIIFS